MEGRVYGSLGYQAKKAVLLTFQDIGRNPFFTGIYKDWAMEYAATDALKEIIELMGAMRSKEFNDFLKVIRADTRTSGNVKSQMSAALGSIAGEDATEELIGQLRTLLTRRRIESTELREAERLIESLGAIVKSPRTEQEARTRIWEFLRAHVPEDLTKLAMHTAMNAFVAKKEQQTKPQRQWAIRVLVRALWLADETTEHHRGGERQSSILGFREEVVNALDKLATDEELTIIHAMEPLTARYGIGFVAAAELFQKLRHLETLPLLERMLNTALMHDEKSGSVYQQDYFWDAGTQERKPLTKREVIPPLVYAIGIVGGDDAKIILKRYQEQISSGRVSPPDPDTAGFLHKFLGDEAFASPGGDDDADGAPPADGQDVKSLLKQLHSGYLFSGKTKRRAMKIQALTRIAQTTPADAMDEVFRHLGDKDPLVSSAAIACLTEYAMPQKAKLLRDLTVNTALDKLESKDPAIREAAGKVLREIGPTRKDVKDKIVAFAKQVDNFEAKDALAKVLRASAGSDTLNAMAANLAGEDLISPDSNSSGSSSAVSKLEQKRQYMQERKQWLTGGKKGDPPAKPTGMD